MVLTIAGRYAMIVEMVTIILSMGTQINIEEALLYPDSTCTLLSYSNIRKNGIHVETYKENKKDFLLFTKDIRQGKETLEKVPSLPSRLYYTYIKHVPYVAYKVIFQNVDTFQTWHDSLGHSGVGMMRKIISN